VGDSVGADRHGHGLVHSPDQIARAAASEGERLTIGGRIASERGRWLIADAFAAVEVEFQGAARVQHGSIVVVTGVWDGRSLGDARVVHDQPIATSTLDLERFTRPGLGAILRMRSQILNEVRRFFEERDFLEVDTPIRSAECGTEVHVEPIPTSGGYLITSPELHMKRLLVAGVPRMFQLVHCFRAGEVGPLHSPEFTLLEWYRAFSSWQATLQDTEQLIQRLARRFLGERSLRSAAGSPIDLTPPFVRLSVREAFARFAGVPDASVLAREDEDQYFQLLVDRVEPAIAAYDRPVFLHDYPASQAALARRSPGDPNVAERYELYVGGVELCNGYGELTDPAEQRERCQADREKRRALGRHVPELPSHFLAALERGMPPASGNALGMERLIALLTGHTRIDAVAPFPPDAA
jgi:lysyl-tRNA synthetase class 2